MQQIPEFTIVGASPAGYTFALALLQQCPSIRPDQLLVIEANTDWRKPGGPFWLAPNALRLLDNIILSDGDSIYTRIQFQGYRAQQHTMRNEKGEWLGAFPHGSKQIWGYDGLRLDRGILLKILAEEMQSRGIEVQYETSLREVVREDDEAVNFTVRQGGTDGCIVSMNTRRLVGADGAHSKTRRFVCGKDVKPLYTGNFMIGGYLPRSKLKWTDEFKEAQKNREFALSITDRGGTLMMIPFDHRAELLGIGRQWPLLEPDRAGWEALNDDKENLHHMFTGDAEQWSEFPRNILQAAKAENPAMWHAWPFYLLPELDQWVSEKSRAVLIGDAAHLLIPAAAQGACQAIEDSWTLAGAYARGLGDGTETQSLQTWQAKRIARMKKISKLSVQLMNVRLSPEQQKRLTAEELFPLDGPERDRMHRVDWLYGYDADTAM